MSDMDLTMILTLFQLYQGVSAKHDTKLNVMWGVFAHC